MFTFTDDYKIGIKQIDEEHESACCPDQWNRKNACREQY